MPLLGPIKIKWQQQSVCLVPGAGCEQGWGLQLLGCFAGELSLAAAELDILKYEEPFLHPAKCLEVSRCLLMVALGSWVEGLCESFALTEQSKQLEWGCQEVTQGTGEGGSDFSSLAGNLASEKSFASKLLLSASGFTFVSKRFSTHQAWKHSWLQTRQSVCSVWVIKVIFAVPN